MKAKKAKRRWLWWLAGAVAYLLLATVDYGEHPMRVDSQYVPGWPEQTHAPTAEEERDGDGSPETPEETRAYCLKLLSSLHLPPSPPDIPTVDCTLPAAVWTDALMAKFRMYLSCLETPADLGLQRALEGPEAWQDFRTYRNKIRDNDGTQETCEKISQDLDDWLRHSSADEE